MFDINKLKEEGIILFTTSDILVHGGLVPYLGQNIMAIRMFVVEEAVYMKVDKKKRIGGRR